MTDKDTDEVLRPLFKGKTSLGVPIEDDPLSDFRKFLYLVWSHLGLPPPTKVQYDMANYLQRVAYSASTEDELQRIIIEAFRGVGKSWITSAFVCWLLYLNPQLNIMVVSASKLRGDDFTTFTLRLIRELPVLKHLVPRRDQRQSNVGFDVAPARASHSASVRSFGITSQMTGGRADVIIADDVEVPGNSATQTMRDKLSEYVKEFDAILKPGGRVIFLGTPQCEMSLYNTLAARGYTMRVWPARYPSPEKRKTYAATLAPIITKALDADPEIVGRSTDPGRFTDIDLRDRENSYGRSGFALQFMLDTSLSDAEKFPLKLSDLTILEMTVEKAPEVVVWGSGPNQKADDLPCVGFVGDHYYRPLALEGSWIDFTGSVMSIDPAGRGADETGFAVVKMLNSNLFVPKAGGISGGYSDETLKRLATIAKEQKVQKIVIEDNFGDGMFTELLKPWLRKVDYPVTIEGVRHSKQKEARIIDVLEPVMNQHRLVVHPSVVKDDFESVQHLPLETSLGYQLFHQMTRLTREKGALVHDDRLDALAIAVGYWTEQMALDQQDRAKERRDDLIQAEVKRMKQAEELGLAVIMGGEPKPSPSAARWRAGRRR